MIFKHASHILVCVNMTAGATDFRMWKQQTCAGEAATIMETGDFTLHVNQ